jgi:hypothetical protein
MFPQAGRHYTLPMKIILILIALFPLSAMAQLFNIRVTDYGVTCTAGALEQAFCDYVDTELAEVEAQVNKDLPSGTPTRLMKGMADSSVMAGKGIGTDYASNMDVFLIGAGAGVGADLHKDKTTDSDLSGAAIAPGLILGMNLSWMDSKRLLGMDTDRLNLYFNFMNYNFEHKINDKPGERSDAELDMMALGVHFRYDWIKGRGNKLLGWGGVKFSFGYEYNKNDISFRSEINENADQFDQAGQDYTGTITGRPEAQIDTTTHSIPLALSTDVQLLYFLSLYTGLGVDYNWGESKGSGDLNGSTSSITCTGAGCPTNPTIQLKPEADINASGKPTPFTARGFLGVQFNIPFVRVFVQADKSLGNDLVSATAGVRFVY